MLLDAVRIERGEDAAEGDLHAGVRADLPREDLRIRVACPGQEAQSHQVRLLVVDLSQDGLVGCLRVGLIEHHALMAGPLEDGGE